VDVVTRRSFLNDRVRETWTIWNGTSGAFRSTGKAYDEGHYPIRRYARRKEWWRHFEFWNESERRLAEAKTIRRIIDDLARFQNRETCNFALQARVSSNILFGRFWRPFPRHLFVRGSTNDACGFYIKARLSNRPLAQQRH
jgi:hypothetical protein